MRYLLGLLLFNVLFSQQLLFTKFEHTNKNLRIILSFDEPINHDAITQHQNIIQIKQIAPIKAIKKNQNISPLQSLEIFTKGSSLIILTKEKSPYQLYITQNNQELYLDFESLLKTDSFDYQYIFVLCILLILIAFAYCIKKYLPKQSQHFMTFKKHPLDSKSQLLTIDLQNKRYIILVTPRGNLLLDAIDLKDEKQ